MDKKDYNKIGKDIKDAVQNAVNSMDFSELNRQITESVNDALAEIQGAFDSVSEEFSKASQRSGQASRTGSQTSRSAGQTSRSAAQSEEEIRRQAREKLRQMEAEINRRKQESAQAQRASAAGQSTTAGQNASAAGQRNGAQRNGTAQKSTAAKTFSSAVIARRPKGSVSNVLHTVFGSVLLGVAVLLALLFGTVAMTGELLMGPLMVILGLVVLPIGGGGLWMLLKGAGDRGRIERFRTYVSCLRDRKYLKISELAAAVHKPEKYVRKDLKKMIEMDMFPQGHLNEDQTMFILDNATYSEYETMRQEVEHKSRILQSETAEQKQLRETVERGQAYIAAIRKANDDIPGEEISEKLFRLEKAVARIYVQIQRSPQKLPELRKFQDYYLPTTLKLVETYREFDSQPIAGENITTAKAEIEASLDTINQAFEKLFDSLFAETAMDVSTDISVLQALLAQEGLTEEAWKKATEEAAEYLKMEQPTEQAAMQMAMQADGKAAAVPDKENEPGIRLML